MSKTINIAYYEKKDYDYFLRIIDDRESMHDSWEEWHQAFLILKNQLVSKGFPVKVVIVDLKELIDYCNNKKIKNDGKARSRFVADKK